MKNKNKKNKKNKNENENENIINNEIISYMGNIPYMKIKIYEPLIINKDYNKEIEHNISQKEKDLNKILDKNTFALDIYFEGSRTENNLNKFILLFDTNCSVCNKNINYKNKFICYKCMKSDCCKKCFYSNKIKYCNFCKIKL